MNIELLKRMAGISQFLAEMSQVVEISQPNYNLFQ
jgi:hypothetical protein